MGESDEVFERVGEERRAFLKKLVVGTAVAVPVVSSFSMHGMQAVFAQTATSSGEVSADQTTVTTAATTSTTTSTTTSSTTTPQI